MGIDEAPLFGKEREYALQLINMYTIGSRSLFNKNIETDFQVVNSPPFFRFTNKKFNFAIHDRLLGEESEYWSRDALQHKNAHFEGFHQYFHRTPFVSGVMKIEDSALYIEFQKSFVYMVRTPKNALHDFGYLLDQSKNSFLDCIPKK